METIEHHTEIFSALFLAATLYAALRGGAPERLALLVFWLGSLTSVALVSPLGKRWAHVEYGLLASDLAMLCAFAALTYHARRHWPLWMTSMQAIEVLCHVPILLAPDVNRPAYMSLQALWAYPMVVLLIIGVRRHRLRLKRTGRDVSWRRSSARS
ncbi:hypothetical protein HZF05_01095 [Sphingomonas sp. CGMCC 1.13654]|uniref:Uncharacterized protein n=1 Tax=Sphingomonas chungangi TaxID=2683589 RepID=A0A838L2N3_9SPHN|nr:hypothetical protein [Sphingomonas chungangi]MBA2932679.1 hypothetical protein [Sphingomonas chungangi]